MGCIWDEEQYISGYCFYEFVSNPLPQSGGSYKYCRCTLGEWTPIDEEDALDMCTDDEYRHGIIDLCYSD